MSQLVFYQPLLYQKISAFFKSFQPEQCDAALEEAAVLFTELLKLLCLLQGSFLAGTRTLPVGRTFASRLEVHQNTGLCRPNGAQ